jgi:hypothetical protein
MVIVLVVLMEGGSFGVTCCYLVLACQEEQPLGSRIAMALARVILAAAFLAAIGPGESAVRGSLVEALEYE